MAMSASPAPGGRNGQIMSAILITITLLALVGTTPVSADSAECVHGKMQKNGICACSNCWVGVRCSQYANHRPFFFRKREEVSLNVEKLAQELEKPIFTAEAVDADEKAACPSKGSCACADILYSFRAGNDNAYFNIDRHTGQVTVNPDLLPTVRDSRMSSNDVHTLYILASNPDSPTYDEMALEVRLWQPSMNEGLSSSFLGENVERVSAGGQHSIHKRAAITLPENVTFTLTKTGNSENTTEMRVGTKVSFQLQILFPQTTTDMLVELFAPDNDSIVMMLCDVTIQSVGSNLVYDGAAEIAMDSQNASTKYFDRAIIDFGNVTNSFAAKNKEADSSIYVTWDAVMIQNDDTVDQAVYWVSAGAEYNREMEVWVGQASFTARTDPEPSTFTAPTFSLTGPSTMKIGTSAVFRLDMFITQPSVSLSIDAFAPLNDSDIMSVCGMKVVDAGDNYVCGFNSNEHEAVLYPNDNKRGHGRARLELGTITNKGARDTNNPKENNRITAEFVVHMYEDESYVGQSYWVGAAVEVGTEQIWAGEILVTAASFVPDNVSPTWEVSKEGNGKVSTVTQVAMTVDVTIPQKTAGRYALEVLAPFNDSAAVFQLCSIRIVGMGDNLICTGTDIAPSYMSRGQPMTIDSAYADLGIITNVGPWGWQDPSPLDPKALAPDVMRVQFFLKSTNHDLAVPGSEHNVNLGLIIGENRLLVGSYSVEVQTPPTLPNITDEKTPDWSVGWVSGDENLAIGGAGQFFVTITTKKNTVYAPFDLEALMPNSTDPSTTQVSVCSVRVHSIGKNLPCIIESAIDKSITYSSLIGDSLKDRAVLSLPSLCNQGLVNDTEEDVLTLKVGIRLQPDSGLTNGTELWPSVGVMFSPYKVWVGQIKAWARDDLVNSVNPPHVVVIKKSGNVPVGYFASYHVLIKTVPADVWPIALNVSVSDTALSVCSVKIIQVGDNLPCTDGAVLEAVYGYNAEGKNVHGSIDFGTVSNVGSGSVARDNKADENSIVVEVMIGLSEDKTVVADGSTHTLTAQVDYGTSTLSPAVDPFTATYGRPPASMTATNVTKTEFVVKPITNTDDGTDVVLGQAKLFQLCTWVQPGSVSKLTMKLLTPVDIPAAMETVFIGLAFAGKNMPCVRSCHSGRITYEKRPGTIGNFNEIATLDLGYVTNNNFDTVDIDANKVCLDGVFRVLKNNSLMVGQIVNASASVNVDDVEIAVLVVPLKVVEKAKFTDTFPDNDTLVNGTTIKVNSSLASPLCLTPGDVHTFPLVVTVPAYVTSFVSMNLKLDVSQSACMTYRNMRLISVGRNLKGFGKNYDLQCSPDSTKGTSQKDFVDCSFGVVTNPGMSHRCQNVTTDDDSLYLEVDLQMADCPTAVKDASQTVSFSYTLASYTTVLNYPVLVCRTGSEAPKYNIRASANSTGQTMYISYNIRLDSASQAEVHNASLVVMAPAYVTCNTLHKSSGTNMAPIVDTSSASRMIINFGTVYFTDTVNLMVRCSANSHYTVPNGISGHYTVVKHQMSGDVIRRDVSTLPSQTVWSDMDFVNFTATTVRNSGITCTSAVVGLRDSNVIYDCQITGSPSSITPVTNGRKGGTGWSPYVRDGELKTQRYIQVFFPNRMLVDRVEVDQTGAAKATQIKLAYSNDGQSFLDGDTITLAGTATEIVQIPNPHDSKVLRVYVTNSDVSYQPMSLTFEFYGCETSSGGPVGSSAICTAAAVASSVQVTNPLFSRRSFLAIPSGAVFVCDEVVKTKATVQRCFVSPDGSVWQALDSRVAAMVGHEPATNRVFALSKDGVTFMSSGDQGRTWASTHSNVVGAAQLMPLYVAAKDVPWKERSVLGIVAPQAIYRIDSWGASYDGLKKNEGTWNSKLTWNCC